MQSAQQTQELLTLKKENEVKALLKVPLRAFDLRSNMYYVF